jgi:hypothetical protein
MRNASDKIYRENQNTFYVQSLFSPKNLDIYGIKWKKTTEDNIIRRMRIACLIPKAVDTHSEYAILTVFPQQ